jgi:hypothetical protein
MNINISFNIGEYPNTLANYVNYLKRLFFMFLGVCAKFHSNILMAKVFLNLFVWIYSLLQTTINWKCIPKDSSISFMCTNFIT